MKTVYFKSRLLALIVCVFAWVGANADVSVTTAEDGFVIVTTTSVGEIGSLSSADKDIIKRATKLRLVGYFNENDMNLFKNSDLNGNVVTHLDLTEAHFSTKSNGKSSQTVEPWRNTLTHLYMSRHETGTLSRWDLFENFNSNLPALQHITVAGHVEIPEGCFQGMQTLQSVVLTDDVISVGKNAFNGCSNLTSLDLGEGVQYIYEQAFMGIGIEELVIPGSVKLIQKEAFINCHSLEKIVFEEAKDAQGNSTVDMVIEPLAFRQADHVWNVYINSEGNIKCENNAFDFATTFGHGDTSAKTATLHYPPSKVDAYCNMDHILTHEIAMDPGQFHDWLLEHYNRANGTPKNGWYEFINSGPSSEEDKVPSEKILKTYSFYHEISYDENGKPISVAKLVPQGVKAYIVNDIVKNTNTGNWEVTLKSIFAIPANTGVLLYGSPNAIMEDGSFALVMNTVAFQGLPIVRGNTTFDSPDSKNMLLPTCVDNNGNEVTNKKGLEIFPYELGDNGKVAFRNFIMTKFSLTDLASGMSGYTDFLGFFRAKHSYIAKGKAYLHMDISEYGSAGGAEAVILQDSHYKREYDYQGNVREPHPLWDGITWTDTTDWGERNLNQNFNAKFIGEPFFEDISANEGGITTLIIPDGNVKTLSGDYYTLQGIKLNNPTKGGVYIHNGKKVVVK